MTLLAATRVVAYAALAFVAGCETIRTELGQTESVDLNKPYWVEAVDPDSGATLGGARVPLFDAHEDGTPLRIGRVPCDQGILLRGSALLLYQTGSRAALLEMLAGVDYASPERDAPAIIEVIGDGRRLVRKRLHHGYQPVDCGAALSGADVLIINVTAPSNVYVTLMLPRLSGVPGMRQALVEAKDALRDARVTSDAADAAASARMPYRTNGIHAFICTVKGEGGCVGLSNEACMVAVSPRGGRVIEFRTSKDNNYITLESTVAPAPHDRRLVLSDAVYDAPWKWRIEPDGTLRLLSPPDFANGIRWSRAFTLHPTAPVMRVADCMKNCVGHAVSWSIGTRLIFPPRVSLMMPMEDTPPGFTLVHPPDDGITARDGVVVIERVDGGRMRALSGRRRGQAAATRAGAWIAADDGQMCVIMRSRAPGADLFPYDGRRAVVRTGAKGFDASLYSPVSPLEPGEFYCSEQWWALGAASTSPPASVTALHATMERAAHDLGGL